MKELQTASIDITYKCNFRCKHCFNSSGEHSGIKQELSDEKILETADEIMDLGVESLCLCGGEPLLRKDLVYKIANLKKKTNTALSMVSNGYLISKQ